MSMCFNQIKNILNNKNRSSIFIENISRSFSSDIIKAALAANLSVMSDILKSKWCYSLAIDAGNNLIDCFLDVRVRVSFEEGILNLRVLSIPLSTSRIELDRLKPVK